MSKIKKNTVHIENANNKIEDVIVLGAKMSGMARTLLLPEDLDTNEIIITDPKNELMDFANIITDPKNELMDFAKYFIDLAKHEVTIHYYNRPNEEHNLPSKGRGVGVDISYIKDGIKLKEFEICDGLYICDEGKQPKDKFFIMSCINDGNMSFNVVPRAFLINDKGIRVDRMYISDIKSAINLCEKFLEN